MELVTITHPKAGTAQVPASAVPHWVHAGWTPAGQEQPAAPAAAQDDKAPRTRRKGSEGEE